MKTIYLISVLTFATSQDVAIPNSNSSESSPVKSSDTSMLTGLDLAMPDTNQNGTNSIDGIGVTDNESQSRANSQTSNCPTCPSCFDCRNSGCTNFGICNANAACSCPEGWGFQDCSKPLCGSLAVFNTSRQVSNLTTPCQCEKNWRGPNCNVCQSDGACGTLASSSLGSKNVCNKSPVVWGNRHFTTCTISSTVLKAAYRREASVTVKRDSLSGDVQATIWLDNTPQFSCMASKCYQTFNSNMTETTWNCEETKCICQPGTSMCGGSLVDISSPVNAASGKVSVSCTSPQECKLDMAFIYSFFPRGINLSNCDHGECVDQYATPVNSIYVAPLIDNIGVASITIAAILVLGIEILLIMGFIDRKKKKMMKLPDTQPGITVSFDNICYSVKSKQILLGVTGAIRAGELLAIMGPSDILARKRKCGKKSGAVLLNDLECPNDYIFRRISGYVDQEDIHLPNLTVRETLEFSAAVRLPEAIGDEEKKNKVVSVMKQLGLLHIADSRIGDALRRGISGGEKKRLSIAVELVTDPAVLFIDEPTSGLDSYNALQVVQTLANLAKESKKTPNSTIFNLFDHILLLNRGQTLYFGLAKEARNFCSSAGFPCPDTYYIADHLLDVCATGKPLLISPPSFIEVKESLRKRTLESRAKILIEESNETMEKKKSTESILKPNHSVTSFSDPQNELQGASLITQIEKVLGRSFKVFIRSPTLFFSHMCLSIALGLFIGFLYYKVDSTIAGLQNRLGSIFFIQALLAFGGLSAISSLSDDKVLFVRERSNGFYSAFPYFLSKIVFDTIPLRIIPTLLLCFISYFLIGFSPGFGSFFKFTLIMVVFAVNSGLHGFLLACLIPETSTSTLAAVMSILFQMLFSGVLVNQLNIPPWISWVQYLSFFKYAYEACISIEAGNLIIKSVIAGVKVEIPASTVLESFGLDSKAYFQDMAITLGLMFGFLGLIFILMHSRLKEKK